MTSAEFTPGKDRIFYTKAVYDQEEIDAVVQCLKDGWLGPGVLTDEFENKIAALFGKRYGLFVNSGSSANQIAMEIANLPLDCEVITQACTFPATLNPIIVKGHTPVFVDSKVGTYNIDVDQIEGAISPKTKAIFISHALGNINDMERIRALCDKYGLLFIEDSCDTHGSLYDGKPPGLWSDITTTSFYASHNITAGGGGGMVMVNNPDLIREAKIYRDWGRALPENNDEDIQQRFSYKLGDVDYDGKFYHIKIGYNFKPVEMQAAFGLVQLRKLPYFNVIRARNFNKIYQFLSQYPEHFVLPQSHPKATVYWLAFPVTLRETSPINRRDFLIYLERNRIQTRLLFTGNILHHEPYRNITKRVHGELTGAEIIMRRTLLIGCNHALTESMVEYLLGIIKQYVEHL
ncbi:hypothetical protein A3H75_00555 [Candidatus Uhrbacteria bacterium RIFCSPLOWO2_02_FULL_51_9]|uniref:NarL family transcriptional regulator n=1 Tax=Candidatus Uhrbacteria bacterium RIFCSPLOWO2_02_FULL_51_9 TaxID=1802410 RepID=A0A1F7VDX1_9BACT|nr:MAG: hypothetical protein A3H75_00555 [Candidatus Uhrbacteria bacterium RIFCSPLOWO2_02_FULL_51_9]